MALLNGRLKAELSKPDFVVHQTPAGQPNKLGWRFGLKSAIAVTVLLSFIAGVAWGTFQFVDSCQDTTKRVAAVEDTVKTLAAGLDTIYIEVTSKQAGVMELLEQLMRKIDPAGADTNIASAKRKMAEEVERRKANPIKDMDDSQ